MMVVFDKCMQPSHHFECLHLIHHCNLLLHHFNRRLNHHLSRQILIYSKNKHLAHSISNCPIPPQRKCEYPLLINCSICSDTSFSFRLSTTLCPIITTVLFFIIYHRIDFMQLLHNCQYAVIA